MRCATPSIPSCGNKPLVPTKKRHKGTSSMTRLTTLLLAGAAVVGFAAVPAVAQQKAPLSILRVIDADNYDPIRTTATAAAEVLYMLADTLVTVDFDMKTIKPGLANSWTVSPDGMTYTFKLRNDVKFCDGRPM